MVDFMYGYTNFMVNLNYLPKKLAKVLAPTDSRWRPDQRALENGDLKLAASEKNRLEEKQRAVRRYREKNKIEYAPKYFEEKEDPNDGLKYYVYNHRYYENDRST